MLQTILRLYSLERKSTNTHLQPTNFPRRHTETYPWNNTGSHTIGIIVWVSNPQPLSSNSRYIYLAYTSVVTFVDFCGEPWDGKQCAGPDD